MTPEKPLRADARRNRARVLDAAEDVFTAQGTTASTEDIARAAGVGVGTVFRHFPTKEALLEAVFVARLRRLAEAADELATRHTDDPGAAFFAFFRMAVDQSSAKNAFAEALEAAGVDVAQAASEVGGDLRAVLERLLLRARAAGAVRPEVGVPELRALLIGTARALESTADPDVRERVFSVLTGGLRPGPH